MNNIVYKYPLKPIRGQIQSVRIPMTADVLDAQFQDGNFVLWASVSDEYESKEIKENRWFIILFTGEKTRECLKEHIATLQLHGLVYHIFEVGSCH